MKKTLGKKKIEFVGGRHMRHAVVLKNHPDGAAQSGQREIAGIFGQRGFVQMVNDWTQEDGKASG